jgi:glycosyltransferase involved in cell wall biosynthesis
MVVNKRSKIVVRVNECDARKGTKGVDDIWKKMIATADHTFFVSNWMKSYFSSEHGEVLINGIDRTRFEKLPKMSTTNGKINIVCAHWSDNALKGQDTYEFLDSFVSQNPDFTFTYIGRTKADLKHSIILPPMNPEQLAKELTRYDVCVNGTYWDPGPNAVMEAIAAGLPTYVRREGGGAAEFAGHEHVYNSVEELKSILLTRDYQPNIDRFDTWEVVMRRVFEKLKALQ